jgi:hypothetical protein
MLTDYPMQVLSILTLAGFASYKKNLVLEDALNQNMLGSFLLVRSLLAFFITRKWKLSQCVYLRVVPFARLIELKPKCLLLSGKYPYWSG